MFALDDRSSFQSLSLWRQEFLHYADIQDPHTFPFIVVGNKVDLRQHWTEINEEARQWCFYHSGLPYFETSAKNDTNIEEVFREALLQWIKRETLLDAEMRVKENSFYVMEQQQKKNQNPCC